jgi:hypothetical protein
MAQLSFSPWKGRPLQRPSKAGRNEGAGPLEQLSSLLPQGVAAMLLPHFKAALPSYAAKDQVQILTAYGVGCLILCDLLSQNKDIPGWREASAKALQILAARAEVEAFAGNEAAEAACLAAEELIAQLEFTGPYRVACEMLDAASQDMSDRKTSERGAVTMRAAMARLEAMTLADKKVRGPVEAQGAKAPA